MYNFGCPNTEMRTRKEEFEKWAAKNKLALNFKMKPDAPHYAHSATRIEFTKFEAMPVVQQSWLSGFLRALQFWK